MCVQGVWTPHGEARLLVMRANRVDAEKPAREPLCAASRAVTEACPVLEGPGQGALWPISRYPVPAAGRGLRVPCRVPPRARWSVLRSAQGAVCGQRGSQAAPGPRRREPGPGAPPALGELSPSYPEGAVA